MRHYYYKQVSLLDYARHEFDLLDVPKKKRIELRRATLDEIQELHDLAASNLPAGIASEEVMYRVQKFNRNNVLALCKDKKIIGLWAMLMLNNLGLEKLLLGEFNPLSPSLEELSHRYETPNGIYLWAVIAPGLAAEGVRYASHFLQYPIYKNSNLFSRPNTELGVQFTNNLGFQPIQSGTKGLYRYTRINNRTLALGEAA